MKGPFARYEHEHRFVAAQGGTLMVDTWEHVAPGGVLGRLADALFLERHVRRILESRGEAIRRAAERSD